MVNKDERARKTELNAEIFAKRPLHKRPQRRGRLQGIISQTLVDTNAAVCACPLRPLQ
jgi:hypothetical protein